MVWHQHQCSDYCHICLAGEYQAKVLSESVHVLSPNIRATHNSSELQGQDQLDSSDQDYMESRTSETKHTAEDSERMSIHWISSFCHNQQQLVQ